MYPRLGLRTDDVMLASFPKSGNTWMRFIWANLVSLREFGGKTVDFYVLDNNLGSEYDSHQYGEVEFDTLPRLVKTHRKYEMGTFGQNRAVYLWRHPGDVAVSFFYYRRAQHETDVDQSDISEFLRSSEVGVPAWCEHLRSWLPVADVVIQYSEMKEDTYSTVMRTFQGLGIEVPEDTVLEKAIQRSSFEEVQRLEREGGRPREQDFEEGHKFARKGEVGQWRDVLSSVDVEYVQSTVEEYGLEEVDGIEF